MIYTTFNKITKSSPTETGILTFDDPSVRKQKFYSKYIHSELKRVSYSPEILLYVAHNDKTQIPQECPLHTLPFTMSPTIWGLDI